MTPTPVTLAFLASDEGRALLAAEAAEDDGDLVRRITRLRRRWPARIASAMVEQLDLRARAAAKFSRAGEMLFTRQGYEQASGENAAAWRAARFPAGVHILDLCCGIGGDAAQLALRGEVAAFDVDPSHAYCAPYNARVYGGEIAAAWADVTRLRLKADAALIDPSRRRDGRRVRGPEQLSPPLSFIAELRERIPNMAVKLSPAMEDATLESLGGTIEFVSDRGECKEAVVWLGAIGPPAKRSAAIIPAGVTLEAADAPPPGISAPRSWLLEPDPAIIRAHLVAEAAEQLGAAQLDPQVAWLTADEPVQTPSATEYELVEWLPFSLGRLQARLRVLGARVEAVKTRGVPMAVDDIQGRIKPAGDRRLVLILTRVRGDIAALLVTPPGG